MSEGTGRAAGRVVNKSSMPVWVLYDKGGVVYAKVLQPGRKSPADIDADAVGSKGSGNTIDGFSGWWKVRNYCKAIVSDNTFGSGIGVSGAPPGSLKKTYEKDWGVPGGNIQYSEYPTSWGEKI